MITFRPLVTNLVVRPTDPWIPSGPGCPCFGLAGLNDETTGSAVLTFPPYAFPVTPAYSVSLNLDHIYTIYASSGGFTEHGVRLSIAPASVPESDSTLTFFVVGLGALLLSARSQKFRPSN